MHCACVLCVACVITVGYNAQTTRFALYRCFIIMAGDLFDVQASCQSCRFRQSCQSCHCCANIARVDQLQHSVHVTRRHWGDGGLGVAGVRV